MAKSLFKVLVREAEIGDSVSIVQLSSQLGYEVGVKEIEDRLMESSLLESTRVVVATDRENRVLGWTQVGELESLIDGLDVQILALVVDLSVRRFGIGKLLVESACRWAASRGHAEIRVRSNAIRKEAHAFYPSLGFEVKKTQHLYRRTL